MKPKTIFMGTPDFAVPILKKLNELTDVLLVVTQPDKVVGRKHEIKFSPVKEEAIRLNIPVFQPEKIKNDMDAILNLEVDLIVTCAYGQILPEILLNHPKIAAINVHASLLPYLRGGAPIHHAIIDGYDKTGVTIMYMAKGMDDGDIISKKETLISDTDNVGSLHDRLSVMGAKLLEETLPSILDGTNERIKQDESLVTFAKIIKREDEHIDFDKSCQEIINLIRGLNPWPMANLILNDEEIKILDASFELKKVNKSKEVIIEKSRFGITCSDGVIYIKTLKPFGKKIMDVKDFLNGIHDKNVSWEVK
jgi:methionyl-tRNA formyltransferase